MLKLKNNAFGFSVVEVILSIVVIVLISTVGYLVYNNNKSTTDSKSVSNLKTVVVDPTANWTDFISGDNKISLKFPNTWAMASNADTDLCANGILLLGANTSSVGKCGSEDFGQISITWQPSHSDCGDLNSDAWTVNSKATVTVSGVSGLKQIATAKAPGVGLGGNPEGTMAVNYCFNTNGYTYIANYTKLASYPDALSDFNLIVIKTLKFSN